MDIFQRLFIWLFVSCLSLGFALGQSFTTPLPIPPLLEGSTLNLRIHEGNHHFFPSVSTPTIGMNEMDYLGPTLLFKKGDSTHIRVANDLNEMVTVHWHGLNVPASLDGTHANMIPAGKVWKPDYLINNLACTMWYHSHRHGMVMNQVNRGLAGMIIIQDDVEAQLPLPRTYGVDDFPLVLQDRAFEPDAKLKVQMMGNRHTMNGAIEPVLECPAQVVRFRILDGANARVYQLGFSDNRTFHQIGTDGGLVEAPIPLSRVTLSNGERAELLLDLSGQKVGDTLYLMNYASELGDGVIGGPKVFDVNFNPLDTTDMPLLKIVVGAKKSQAITSIPSSLVPIDFIPASASNNYRKKVIDPEVAGEPMTIDGKLYNMMRVDDTVILGSTEIWEFENQSSVAHPMHLHDVQFQVLDRDGRTPPANERGWKDVVLVHPFENVRIISRFLNFADSNHAYMWHCHNLHHEDDGMMYQFIVIDTVKKQPVDTVITSVEPLEAIKVHVFPTPVQEQLSVVAEGIGEKTELIVLDVLGQEVIRQKALGQQKIYTGDLKDGVYFLLLEDDSTGRFVVQKIVKGGG